MCRLLNPSRQPVLSLSDSLLLLDWKDIVNDVHFAYKKTFLQELTVPEVPFEEVIPVRANGRLATVAMISCNGKNIWLPFIVDTGAPRALYLSQQTWKMFDIDAIPRDVTAEFNEFTRSVSFGKWGGDALLSEENGASKEHVKDANIIGLEILNAYKIAKAVNEVLMNAAAFRKVVRSYWVKYGDTIFKVTPATSDVDSLKKAVKAEMQLQQPAPTLVVKDHKKGVLSASAELEGNTDETAYIVTHV